MKTALRYVLFPVAFVGVLLVLVAAFLWDGRRHMENVLDGMLNWAVRQ